MEKASTIVVSNAKMAVYFDARGRAMHFEDVENVKREISPVTMLKRRSRPHVGPTLLFSTEESSMFYKTCCIHGKCFPCSIFEYLYLKLLEFFQQLFGISKTRTPGKTS
jgi:hypothetical protein